MDQAAFRTYLRRVDAKVDRIGTVRSVYADLRNGPVHVDVYIIDIDTPMPRTVLLTVGCGLVDRGRQPPVELAMVLPRSWPMSEAALREAANFWPFGWLRFIGSEMPRLVYGPFPGDLFRMHPEGARASGRFSALLGVSPEWISPVLSTGVRRPGDQRKVHITPIIPVTEDERRWAIARGADAEDGEELADLLESRAHDAIVVDMKRDSFVPSEP